MSIEQFYFPNKVVNYTNFPELRMYKADIERIIVYAIRAELALADYSKARYDRVDLNMEEIQTHIDLCRQVCEGLGLAGNVCFDVLLEVRTIQEQLQNLSYLKRKFGSGIVGEPTKTTSEDRSVV